MLELFNTQNLINISIGLIILLILVYALPFAISPLIRLIFTLWGYYLGSKRKRSVLASNPIIINIPEDSSTKHQCEKEQENDMQRIIDSEFKYLEIMIAVKKNRYDEALRKINEKIDSIKEEHRNNKEQQKNNETSIGKLFNAVKIEFNKELGSNVLLGLIVGVVLFVDTLIANEIFQSLNIATTELTTVHKIPIKYSMIYGLFMTLTIAFLLHWLWPRRKLQAFITNNQTTLFIGLGIIILFLIARFWMVAVPDSAKDIVEIITLICWSIGIIAVYWLGGEIIGEPPQWFKLVIALLIPFVVSFLLLFGVLKIVEVIFETILSVVFESWFQIIKARKNQQEENLENSNLASKQGFYRGFTN